MKRSNNKQTVLITGASSGIGYASALHMARSGMQVYAGVRKEDDKERLQKEGAENLTPIILDVCNQETIDLAFVTISDSIETSTFNLVNNAGVSLNGPLEILPLEDIESLIRVNVTGLLAVTRSFIPLIRKTSGSLINISSGHGLMAIPDKSAYAASKICCPGHYRFPPGGIASLRSQGLQHSGRKSKHQCAGENSGRPPEDDQPG